MEKLWTTTEAAHCLGISDEDVIRLTQEGRLTGYKLAGQFLRFKPEQVQALKGRGVSASRTRAAAPAPMQWAERLRNFVYFYDFYLFSFLLLTVVVLYLISAT